MREHERHVSCVPRVEKKTTDCNNNNNNNNNNKMFPSVFE